MKDEIIKYIRKNVVSSTEVADAMGKEGAVEGIKAVNRGHFKVGTVHWVYANEESNWNLHKMIETVKEGEIVIVDAINCKDRAVLGDIVSKFILLYKGANALVVKGNIRDVHRVLKENWAVWSKGFNPIGCFNKEVDSLTTEEEYEYRKIYDNAIAVCDDTGVVIIPENLHNEDFLKRLEDMEEQEDVWYECIDRKKWSTFETICLKKYQEDDLK